MKFDISAYGERHLLIQFDQAVDLAVNRQVHALKRAILSSNTAGVLQVVPAYCSLSVLFDPNVIGAIELTNQLNNLDIQETGEESRSLYRIPVCYDSSLGWDIEEVQKLNALTKQELIELHTTPAYHTFMLGFLPGFPYLGKLTDKLQVARRAHARTRVFAGAVGLAGDQTGIYPSEAPGGWQIVGATPVPMFQSSWQHPALLREGDKVQFFSVNLHDYHLIAKDIKSGNFNYKSLHVW